MRAKKFREIKQLNLPQLDKEVLAFWQKEEVFTKSVEQRKEDPSYVFYEGPPSANGLPGIHHVMARSIKDLFCRYKTMQGFQVKRKGGWDTHGLPVELQVEKKLNISKDDIGTTVSVEDYNNACRSEVLKYKDVWEDLTLKMGFWLDMKNPYITFENNYIETLWHILKQLYNKGLLYKGYSVQPFSPAAGTGLSSHELNMPGAYRLVKDHSVVAQFKLVDEDAFLLAWTTTPWTLPSNTALGLGQKIDYVKIKTFNAYTHLPVTVILAKDVVSNFFKKENETFDIEQSTYKPGDKNIPYQIIEEFKGSKLAERSYEQLLPYAQPNNGDAFKIIMVDFVTTTEGTGIVHLAPSFGSDDMQAAKQHGVGSLTLVDKHGRFTQKMGEFAGRAVKNFWNEPDYEDVDIDIIVTLKKENKAFRAQKYEHNYPHCWRTDKPVLYYPLDSWFIKTTAVKEKLLQLNQTINWKPASTGTGRFGHWLENLVDWNLSRSRFWGTPLPIWRTNDGKEEKCIGSIEELRSEVEKAVSAGFMSASLPEKFDLHKPFVDEIMLVSDNGKKMKREPALIDVWFDSGAMPYAQHHWPFSGIDIQKENLFPADFIAEGVDQTRGWFFTLHTLAVMLFNSVAFKNVVSNGLVLDKKGNKMSKRLGNAIDPFDTIEKYGADATRWYILSNSQPWDNLKFDVTGIREVQRKFFGTLFNTYSFFALYANIDDFNYREEEQPLADRPEIDRWILSRLNTLVKQVTALYDDYEPTKATRLIQSFVIDHLSNWYVRLSRRRFWKGEYNENKIAAYQTLYTCLETLSLLIAPAAPFFADFLYKNLNDVVAEKKKKSVHLADFPKTIEAAIDNDLEERMQLAQDASSMVLSLRKRENIRVRQPLAKLLIPVTSKRTKAQLEQVKPLILSEVNVKTVEFVHDTDDLVTKSIKPDYKALGKKLGLQMKAAAERLSQFSQQDINRMEKEGQVTINVNGDSILLNLNEVLIQSEDIEGWLVTGNNRLTVALDVHIDDNLKNEGLARELVNRIQNLRKAKKFGVTDRIVLKIIADAELNKAFTQFSEYIKNEVLAETFEIANELPEGDELQIDEKNLRINLTKI